jgi:ribonuclease R
VPCRSNCIEVNVPPPSTRYRRKRDIDEAAMPSARKSGTGALPSREEIVAFLAASGGKAGKRDIARHFRLKGGARIDLKALLREAESEGILSRARGHFHRAGDFPSVVAAEIASRDRDGEFLALPVEWDETRHGATPSILVLPARKQANGEPVPGIGDRVLLKIVSEPGEAGRLATARVMKILGRRPKRLVGVVRRLADGRAVIVPAEKRAGGREIPMVRGGDNGARDGDVVSVAVERSPRFGAPQARILENLGSLKSERAVSLLAIHAHGVPFAFAEKALAEAQALRPVTLAGRQDRRDIAFVTIDPADAKDHDDAVHAARDTDPNNAGGFVCTVAIADVAHYVRPDTALDREALERGNSVYFPDRVVPMLPERISNDLCSLRPNEDRPALAVRMIFDHQGRKRQHSFQRILMRSLARLSYEQAQAGFDGNVDAVTGPRRASELVPLWEAYAVLRNAREARSPLDLDLPERRLILDKAGHVERVVTPQRLDAHRLIEEFMIQANVAAAETLERTGVPLIYRVHDEPSIDKVNALGEVLASVGIKFAKGERLRPELFNRILRQVADAPYAPLVNETILRSQAQAEYAAENYGHFGLNLRRYAHFTSPIRRYADLMVHRALISGLGLGKDGLPDGTTPARLAEIAAMISMSERRALAAERETSDRLIAHFLADRVGANFRGRIAGVTKAGCFVRLDETGADGFVPMRSLGQDYFAFDPVRHAVIGSRTGLGWRLGDTVDVELREAQPVSGALRFAIISDPSRLGALPAQGKKAKARPSRVAARGFGRRNAKARRK